LKLRVFARMGLEVEGMGKTYERSQPSAEATNKDKSYSACQQMCYDGLSDILSSPFILRGCEDWCREDVQFRGQADVPHGRENQVFQG
jgi:hypothetical protein